MNIFERQVGGRRYRIASQSLWDPAKQRPFARQAVLGSADPAPVADLAATCTVGTRLVGDIGALVWVAEQLDLIRLIDQACGLKAPRGGPTVGEMGPEGAATRALVGIRGGDGEGNRGASITPLARRRVTKAIAGAHAPGAARFVYRPS